MIRTHLAIDPAWCGHVLELAPGRCLLALQLTPLMRADAAGLVHGGFIFGTADYAAMLAVNEPTVVVMGAEVRFLKPCRVGETITVKAEVVRADARRPVVAATVLNAQGEEAFTATFSCAVPALHVLQKAG